MIKTPFAFLVASDATDESPLDYPEAYLPEEGAPNHLLPFVKTDGLTYTLDLFIGEEKYLGKGLSLPLISQFRSYLSNVKAFLIDPECSNAKAIHVYQKAGFEIVDRFIAAESRFKGKEHF